MDKQEKQISNLPANELWNHYEEMKEIASRDALTGVLNRYALEREINERLRTMGESECCALFIVDLDNFKAVNDTLGHQAGDQVIIKAARLLSGMFRATDIVGRLGGDEFIIFLSGNLTEEMVRSKGQVICDQLQYVMGVSSQVVVTASVGIHLSVGGKSFEYLYHSADLALYKAKKSGKQSYCIKMNTDEQEEMQQEKLAAVNAVRIRSLLDYIDSGVAMIDVGEPMTFVYASSAFARMLGIDKKELEKTSVVEFIHLDDRNMVLELFKKKVIEKNETVSQVTRVVSRDGRIHWWRVHAVRVEYGEKKPLVLITVVDISDFKEKESILEQKNDVLQMAMNQTTQGIWELELASRSFHMMGENESFPKELSETQNFPEDLIESQWISPESASAFRDFAEEIFNGRIQGYANFKIRYCPADHYGWASFSYRAVFNEEGLPIRVVGVIEGMNYEGIKEEHRLKSISPPGNLMDSLVFQFNGNLTAGTVVQCWREGKDMIGEKGFQSCSRVLRSEMKRTFTPEKGVQFSKMLSKNALLLAYRERKTRWMSYEYRRIDSGGMISWVSCVINLYADPQTDEVYVAMWISDLEKRHRWETKFDVNIYKDPISKLYTRSTVRELSSRLLEQKKHKLCGLVMVEIGGMASMYAQYSGNMDEKWKGVVTALMLAMGTRCVPGQFGTDQYLFFFPSVASEDALKRKLEHAILFVRNITSDLVDGRFLRFMVGGICRYQNETSYNILMKKVQTVCQKWTNASGDRIVFADDSKEEGWEQLKKSIVSDQLRMPQEEVTRPLLELEKDAAFQCVLGMLNADSLAESARCVLKTLGEYYEADRAYILVPVDRGNIVTMPHEWTSSQKASIQHVVSGMITSKFPLLERCVRENKPVFLSRQTPMMDEKNKEDYWNFAIFPMRDEGEIQSFLCIENARNYIADATLPSLLSSCLLKERKKYLKHARPSVNENGLLDVDLPNQNSYMENIYTYNSDVYSALGAVCVDVPEFSLINGTRGFEYGRKLLWYVMQTMSDIFGRGMLYRTWDAEFVALCPNTTQQIFFGKCARLRAALSRRYPKDFRLGYTWTDNVFNGKTLVDEAKVLMRCDVPDKIQVPANGLPSALSSYKNVGDMINAGRFTVYFQPKMDIKTGKLVGAEALVRGVEKSGKIIPPGAVCGRTGKERIHPGSGFVRAKLCDANFGEVEDGGEKTCSHLREFFQSHPL